MLAVKALKPVFIPSDLQQLSVSGDLVTVDLLNLPLEWVDTFVPDMDLSAQKLSGKFVVGAEGQTIELKTKSPLALEGFSLATKDGGLVERITVQLSPGVKVTETRAEFQSGPVSVRSPHGLRRQSPHL